MKRRDEPSWLSSASLTQLTSGQLPFLSSSRWFTYPLLQTTSENTVLAWLGFFVFLLILINLEILLLVSVSYLDAICLKSG